MCSVTAGLIAASAVMGAYGQHQDAKASAAAARAQADAAEQNARIEGKKQELQADKYNQERLHQRAQARLAEGKVNANAGAAGLGAGEGSSIFDILSSSEAQFRQDRQNLEYNAALENWNSRVQQANYVNQASALRAQADNTLKSSKVGIASTLLGAAAAISGNVKAGSSKAAGSGSSVASNVGSVSTPVAGGSWSWNAANGAGFRSNYNNLKNYGLMRGKYF